MKNQNKKIISTIILLVVAGLFGSSRVTFSRPGPMMRIPYTTIETSPYWFNIGVSSDVYDFSPQIQTPSAYFDMFITSEYNFGLTHATILDSAYEQSTSEFGIHLQRRVYDYKGVSISLGLQDILFTEDSEIDSKKISAYMVLSSKKELGDYKLNSFMGFGSGKIGNDPHFVSNDDPKTSAGVFVGFLFNTPYLKKNGGMDFIGEYINSGINVGVHIPVTPNYRFDVAITHFEKFGDFGKLESTDSLLTSNAPSISFGFSMSIPKPNKESKTKLVNGSSLPNLNNEFVNEAKETIVRLRDSLKVNQNTIENLTKNNKYFEQKISNLVDSTRVIRLENMVSESNLNASLRHLARSLRLYYEGQYQKALQEAESSLQITPSLALAYARRGSIYYKLGDIQKATINWNLALKLDSEYEEVRIILQALKENRLESTSLINNKEG